MCTVVALVPMLIPSISQCPYFWTSSSLFCRFLDAVGLESLWNLTIMVNDFSVTMLISHMRNTPAVSTADKKIALTNTAQTARLYVRLYVDDAYLPIMGLL